MKAPEGFVRQGSEESLYDGTTIISPLEQTTKGTYKENPQSGIVITVSSNTAHQIDPDTGAAIVEVEQKNDEQVGRDVYKRQVYGRIVDAGGEYSTEMVSPKLSYDEMGKLQEVVRCLRQHGGFVNESCGQHVHVDASNHTPQSLKNALTIMLSLIHISLHRDIGIWYMGRIRMK